MCVISQGDRGKPGPVGPPGELGEKVRGHGSCRCILCVQVLLFMVIHVCFFLKNRVLRGHLGREDNQVML